VIPSLQRRKREISNESAWDSSLREANILVRAKRAPHDGKEKVKTLQMMIWYKRDCNRQTTRQPSLAVQPHKKDVKKNVGIKQVPN